MLFEQHDKSSPLNYAQYDGVAPQNGDRIATTDICRGVVVRERVGTPFP